MSTTTTAPASLPYGYRADWEGNGNRVAIYTPMQQGYRALTVFAELTSYVPGWGTRADTVTEWRAYRSNDALPRTLLESRPIDSFNSPDEIVAWLAGLI